MTAFPYASLQFFLYSLLEYVVDRVFLIQLHSPFDVYFRENKKVHSRNHALKTHSFGLRQQNQI